MVKTVLITACCLPVLKNIINHYTIRGCKAITSMVLHVYKICHKLPVISSLNNVSPEPDPVGLLQKQLVCARLMTTLNFLCHPSNRFFVVFPSCSKTIHIAGENCPKYGGVGGMFPRENRCFEIASEAMFGPKCYTPVSCCSYIRRHI